MPPLRVTLATARAALRARALRTSALAASTVTTDPSRGPLPNSAGEKNTTPPREQKEKVADGAPMAHGTDYEAGGTPPKSTTQRARTHLHICVSHRHMFAPPPRAPRALFFPRRSRVLLIIARTRSRLTLTLVLPRARRNCVCRLLTWAAAWLALRRARTTRARARWPRARMRRVRRSARQRRRRFSRASSHGAPRARAHAEKGL
jgi:hypothetical protein